ncbi:MBL fold metallo-hydrolase [Candidatus Peregrinibacteria bacterium]|jgi:competence protein ComEC|nr:MBL fold metallo-hydrolase [Candidatus Peregrinibacteria bacterium]
MKCFFKIWVPGAFIFGVLVIFHFSRVPHGELWVDFLDVGQGDAILVTVPSGEQVLIDGGPEQIVLEELAEVMPFLDRKIEVLVLTHPHADHVMGLVPVLQRYEVGAVLLTGAAYENPVYDAFLAEIRLQNIPLWIAQSEADFRFGEVFFDVLYPFESVLGQEFKNINNSSIVLRVSWEDFDVVLTGDAEHEVEKELLVTGVDLKAEVLKAGHHGSRTATGAGFLAAVSPETVVIQCGADNQFAHPHKETLARLESLNIQVLRNDLEGRIRISYPVYSNSHSKVN